MAKPKLEALFSKIPELDKVNVLKEVILDCLDSPDELSKIIIEMSICLVRIGGLTADLIAKANESYIYRKYRYLGEYHSLSGAIEERKHIAEHKTYEERVLEVVDRFIADFFKSYMEEHSRVIMTAQSRLSLLKGEIARSGIQS